MWCNQIEKWDISRAFNSWIITLSQMITEIRKFLVIVSDVSTKYLFYKFEAGPKLSWSCAMISKLLTVVAYQRNFYLWHNSRNYNFLCSKRYVSSVNKIELWTFFRSCRLWKTVNSQTVPIWTLSFYRSFIYNATF